MTELSEAGMTIGALARATGVPAETIRTWERRYGFPVSGRNEVGHRVYALEAVEYVRLVALALKHGHRPKSLEGVALEELRRLVRATVGSLPALGELGTLGEAGIWLEEWMTAVITLDRVALERSIHQTRAGFDTMTLLNERLHPFIVEIGQRWSSGRIGVLHEHFASEVVRDFLSGEWRSLSATAIGPPYILCTLPGEQHTLGLHMAALVVALCGAEPVFIGADTPVVDIALVAAYTRAPAVMLSLARGRPMVETRRDLVELRGLLDASIKLVIGGAGAPEAVAGVEHLPDFEALRHWLGKNSPRLDA
ncbi:MAG: MerR family transcriptional regulator [Bradymonadaceae bacterium]|nr:MerR family transcriptional regulator [Lujinxingiaceae bacterium]